MIPLKRCKTKGANVIMIDIEDDDDDDGDVIVVDSPGSSHPKKGESNEQRENQRVSPQSVIRIDDDDENESYTNQLSAHDEEGEGTAESESDATSSHRSRSMYDIPHDARSYEYEPIEIDSDCEVMEDPSGMLRELWEKAASQRKVNRHNANSGHEDLEAARARNANDVWNKNMNEPFSEGPSCSKVNAPFDAEISSTFGVMNEDNPLSYEQDTLFPEFDWRNLSGRCSFKKHISSNIREGFKNDSSKTFDKLCSKKNQSQHIVDETSFGLTGNNLKEQCSAISRETEGTDTRKFVSGSHSAHEMNINQAQLSADHLRDVSPSHGENSTTDVECNCVFPSDCNSGRRRDFGLEEQIPSVTPREVKSQQSNAGFDSKSGDAPNNSPVGMECEADCEIYGSKVTDEELEKLSTSETEVRQDSFPQAKGSSMEKDPNYVQEGGINDTPVMEGIVGKDIINDKEKLKETAEYKRAMEEEWASRQQQLKLQAEEAQRLRKRKKAEQLRVSNMEKRQKQRLEEVRESQKQDLENLNLKEQLRSEVFNELKVLETRCFNMASLLRSLGVQVEGGAHPSQQQIQKAYKRAVLKFHPDRTSGNNLKQQVEAEEKFKLISRMKEKYKLG